MTLFSGVGATLKGKNGEYTIVSQVARGGMEAVYKAICPWRHFIPLPF